MSIEYRPLTPEDYEQAAHVEAVAFYNKPTPARVEMMREFLRPEWTVAAFVEGKLVADVRTLPMQRRINGGSIGLGAVGPVACLADYRRQGHVGKLLSMALERMREFGQPLSGLHTPHDALYARYGWERAEGKKRYEFWPKDVRLRLRGEKGSLQKVGPDDWGRLDAIYRSYAEPRNGPFVRIEPWWRVSVLQHWVAATGEREDSEAFVWVSRDGRDEGYLIYHVQQVGLERGRWPSWGLIVRDFVTLSSDAYLGLWEHLLTHDLARHVSADVPPHDPFPHLTEEPQRIEQPPAEGAMIRIVDVERAIGLRPYCGDEKAGFTMRVSDQAAPWNEGTWHVEAIEGRIRAERTLGEPDLELTVNTLAPIFTGHLHPEVAAGVGLVKAQRAEALREMARAFAVTYPPYCNDSY